MLDVSRCSRFNRSVARSKDPSERVLARQARSMASDCLRETCMATARGQEPVQPGRRSSPDTGNPDHHPTRQTRRRHSGGRRLSAAQAASEDRRGAPGLSGGRTGCVAREGSTARSCVVSYLVDANVLSEATRPRAERRVVEWLDQHDTSPISRRRSLCSIPGTRRNETRQPRPVCGELSRGLLVSG